jgi:hypothetical protein
MKRIKYCDCTDNEIANENKNITCVFIGYDRYFYQYTFDYSAANFGAVVNPKRYEYYMYKDYEPEDIDIGSQYIVIKARSKDNAENSILTYKRVDKGGFGYLYSGLNGTQHRFNDQDWKNTRVELAEYGSGHKIFVQRREDTRARIFAIDSLRVTNTGTDQRLLEQNCIRFIGSDHTTKCLNMSTSVARTIPNQNGVVPKPPRFSRASFWLKVFLSILAALIMLGAIAYVLALLRASPKPGVYSSSKTVSRPTRGRVVEERVYRDSSTNRHLDYSYDDAFDASQEHVYGDSAVL